MKLLLYIADLIIPLVLFGTAGYGLFKKVDVYGAFIKGARDGFFTVIKIMPTLIGLMTAVGVLRASGFLDIFSSLIGKAAGRAGFPGELVPLAVVKMFSSSAAWGLLADIFKKYGTDGRLGLIASISMSCTETIFYTVSVYFAAVKIQKTRYTLKGALIASLAGLAASVAAADWIQGFNR